jgi:hypothetical protein
VRDKHGAHEDGATTAPHAGFDHISGHPVTKDCLYATIWIEGIPESSLGVLPSALRHSAFRWTSVRRVRGFLIGEGGSPSQNVTLVRLCQIVGFPRESTSDQI